MKTILLITSILLMLSMSGAIPPDAKPDKTPQSDTVIAKGMAYLKSSQKEDGSWRNCPGTTALALKAIVHTGVPRGYEDTVEKAVAYLLANSKFDKVYETALLAMALEDLDAKKYRDIIGKCARFLHGSQLPHGMWTYRKVSDKQWQALNKQFLARPTEKKEEETQYKSLTGDNSNTQFALLGLRAVRWAGVHVDMQVIRQTQEHFRRTQHAEGSWGYREYNKSPTGSMTCAGVASLCILDDIFKSGWYFKRRKIRKDNVAKGIQWMRDNFSVSRNPGGSHYYYYMYSMERAGMLTKRKQFGEHDWYKEGAPVLCADQRPDGKWGSKGALSGKKAGRQNIESDTSFAILFLKEGATFHKPLAMR